jgi:hypothetical protein
MVARECGGLHSRGDSQAAGKGARSCSAISGSAGTRSLRGVRASVGCGAQLEEAPQCGDNEEAQQLGSGFDQRKITVERGARIDQVKQVGGRHQVPGYQEKGVGGRVEPARSGAGHGGKQRWRRGRRMETQCKAERALLQRV